MNSSQLSLRSFTRSTRCSSRGSPFGKPDHRVASKNGVPSCISVGSQEAKEMGRNHHRHSQANVDSKYARLRGATDSDSDPSPELLKQMTSYIHSHSKISDPKTLTTCLEYNIFAKITSPIENIHTNNIELSALRG